MKGSPLVLLLSLLCAACSHGSLRTEHALLREQGAPFRGDVEVLRAGPPGPPFEEVALIQVVARGDDAQTSVVLGALKRRAALLGCNVVAGLTLSSGDPGAATGVCGVRAPDVTDVTKSSTTGFSARTTPF